MPSSMMMRLTLRKEKKRWRNSRVFFRTTGLSLSSWQLSNPGNSRVVFQSNRRIVRVRLPAPITRSAASMPSGLDKNGFSQSCQETHQSLVVSPISTTSTRAQFIQVLPKPFRR
jgi:hypothetical protein